MNEETGKVKFMMRLFKNAFEIYKDNFKYYIWFIFVYTIANNISLVNTLYFKANAGNPLNTIISMLELLIIGFSDIMITYLIFTNVKNETGITLLDLFYKVRDRFWKSFWTMIKVYFKSMLLILAAIIITFVLGIILYLSSILKYNATMNINATLIYMSILVPIILVFMVLRYAFVYIIAINENVDEDPFIVNKNILKGNYKLISLPIIVLIIPIIMAFVLALIFNHTSNDIRFWVSSIMVLINSLVKPFKLAVFILLYNYLKKKYDEKNYVEQFVGEVAEITEIPEIDE